MQFVLCARWALGGSWAGLCKSIVAVAGQAKWANAICVKCVVALINPFGIPYKPMWFAKCSWALAGCAGMKFLINQ